MLRAKEALLTVGYSPKYRLSVNDEKAYLDSHHDYKFVRSGDGSIVDVQWGITQWSFVFPLDFGELWKNREVISMAGVSVPTPSAEDLLLILCVHGTKHYWEQLKWICDVAELVNTSREKVDWARLLNRSQAVGGERMLLLGLSLSHDLLGACLPDELMTRIKNNSHVKSLARQVIRRLFDDRVKADRLLEERPFFLCLARERWRDKVAIALRYLPDYFRRLLVPNDRDEAFLRLPRYLSLGYYLVRPVRLLKAYWSESNGRSVRARK
jgi:hypothetical protein